MEMSEPHEDLPGEENTTELSLDEELGVEGLRSGVERQALDGRVHVVGCSNAVAVDNRAVSISLTLKLGVPTRKASRRSRAHRTARRRWCG